VCYSRSDDIASYTILVIQEEIQTDTPKTRFGTTKNQRRTIDDHVDKSPGIKMVKMAEVEFHSNIQRKTDLMKKKSER